jgi:hypothetical protein
MEMEIWYKDIVMRKCTNMIFIFKERLFYAYFFIGEPMFLPSIMLLKGKSHKIKRVF